VGRVTEGGGELGGDQEGGWAVGEREGYGMGKKGGDERWLIVRGFRKMRDSGVCQAIRGGEGRTEEREMITKQLMAKKSAEKEMTDTEMMDLEMTKEQCGM